MSLETPAPRSPFELNEDPVRVEIAPRTLVLMAGLPGSGKTTFARKHFPMDAIVSTDELRRELSNHRVNQLVSDTAFKIASKIVQERLAHGGLVVFDAQNLSSRSLSQFYKIAKEQQARIEVFFMNVSAEESLKRNAQRDDPVETDYISRRGKNVAVAARSFQKSQVIDRLHFVEPNNADRFTIVLPDDERTSKEADDQIASEAKIAEARLRMTALEASLKPEQDSIPILIDAGSLMYIQQTPESKAFLAQNFLPHQIVDLCTIASRLHADINDPAVGDVASMVLKHRAFLNLTTVVSYPEQCQLVDRLRADIRHMEEKRKITVPQPTLSFEEATSSRRVEIVRHDPDAVPLLIVGDIQGCYQSMREIASRVRRENMGSTTERKIIFVGDMADRGPFDAEAVIYITALVRSGRAMLIRGNHDENLLQGLRGEDVRSSETRQTIAELQKRLKPASIKKIIAMLEQAPRYASWKGLSVVHASLPRLPRAGESLSPQEEHMLTYGAKNGSFTGSRAEVHRLRHTIATDPGMFVVGGHTHDQEATIDPFTNTLGLDVGVELRGVLHAMYYPEREIVTSQEPTVVRLYDMLTSAELPMGNDLLLFIEYARQQSLLEVKDGQQEFTGLKIVSYSGITEVTNAWAEYPVLRHFRGLIVGKHGEIVARPFHKSHKAGAEIPLETLNMIPENVFEKANGSLGIVYHWQGRWRCATKFSFQNEGFTMPAERMLNSLNTATMDPSRTYLFEIILPHDKHIVEYHGREALVLLNSVETASGNESAWHEVVAASKDIGVRTAEDMTAQFAGMTIADIYRMAQTPGTFPNLEGLMALMKNDEGQPTRVKIKCREYDDKKFVRDRLDWERILDSLDTKTLVCPSEARDELLGYGADNPFVEAALTTRLEWIQEEYQRVSQQVRDFLFAPYTDAERVYEQALASHSPEQALASAMRAAVPTMIALLDQSEHRHLKEEQNALFGFLRSLLSKKIHPQEALAGYALKKIRECIARVTKEKGKNAFWILP